jgi:transcriptional regulator with XRE-family HTH domain
MTPFGAKVRALRAARGETLKDMAEELHISAAYLSALEHGHRGRPGANLVRQICDHFELIWDDAEALQRLARRSHPRVVIDTAGLTPAHTELANALAEKIAKLDEATAKRLIEAVEKG